jgi:Phage tail tube protein
MATQAAPRGANVISNWIQESSFGVAPGGNWTGLRCYSDTLEEKQPWQSDPVLGAQLNNARDPSDPAPGLPAGSGQVDWPLDLDSIGFALDMVLGAPVTTGTTPNYQHVFSSGGDVVPHWSREKRLKSGLYHQANGIIGKKLSVQIGRAAGFDRMTVDYLLKKDSKQVSSAAGTPAALTTRVPLLRALPVFKLDSVVVADVISLNLAYDNGAVEQDYLGDAQGYPLGHDLDDEPSCTGSIKARLRGTGLWDQAKQLPAVLDSALGEVLWQVNSNRSLLLSMAAMWLEPVGAPTTNKGRIEQTFNFRCSQTGATPMLVATLKSPTATFP